jgi:hypothetical protein
MGNEIFKKKLDSKLVHPRYDVSSDREKGIFFVRDIQIILPSNAFSELVLDFYFRSFTIEKNTE